MSNQNVSTRDRFMSNLPERRHHAVCWNWQGATSNGYGILNVDGKKTYAHRYSVVFHGRKIRHGFVVDHLCSNRKCVNPHHLEAVTMQENARRGVANTASERAKIPSRRRGYKKKTNDIPLVVMLLARIAALEIELYSHLAPNLTHHRAVAALDFALDTANPPLLGSGTGGE